MSTTFTTGGSATLFILMLIFLEVGRRLGVKQIEKSGPSSLGAIDGALLGLLSLVLAFTFSSAAGRFDERRRVIIEETNAIGTAWLRIDLLPADMQPIVRADFRRYVDSRLLVHAKLPDLDAAIVELDRSRDLAQQIWIDTMAALRAPETAPIKFVVVNAMNAVIDFQTKQTMMSRLHPPAIIYWMLVVLALICSFVVGEVTSAISVRWWLHSVPFAALFTVTFFTILELEYPRLGLLNVRDFDRELIQLRHDMGT